MRYGWLVVAVALAAAAHASDAQAKLDLYVDKSNQRITVVRDGYVRYVWPVATARDSYAPPNGVYTPARLERSNSPMPYTISFHDGYAMHGSYDLTNLSGPASHGSIRPCAGIPSSSASPHIPSKKYATPTPGSWGKTLPARGSMKRC